METKAIMTVAGLSENLTELFLPFIAVLMVILFGLAIKDAAASIVKGMAFRFNGAFKEGDTVFLDGERAIIVKIGMLQSVFGVTKSDGTSCWRYVTNTRIDILKLEKIIEPSPVTSPGKK